MNLLKFTFNKRILNKITTNFLVNFVCYERMPMQLYLSQVHASCLILYIFAVNLSPVWFDQRKSWFCVYYDGVKSTCLDKWGKIQSLCNFTLVKCMPAVWFYTYLLLICRQSDLISVRVGFVYTMMVSNQRV